VLVYRALCMAKGWRGLLEEESEHQWIAMATFFIFILLGAVLIQGTSSLPGVDYQSYGLDYTGGEDGRVLNIVYDNDAYVAVVYGTNGAVMVYNDGSGYEENIGGNYDDLMGLPFMTQLSDGSVATSPTDNTIEVIEHDGKSVEQTRIDLDQSNGIFSIKDLAEQSGDDSSIWVMVTNEEGTSSFRGFGSIDETADSLSTSVQQSQLTAAMINNGDITWNSVESLGDGRWVASGLATNAFSNEDVSPATPIKHPVLGIISWSKAPAAPTLTTFEEYTSGEFHSLLKLEDGSVLAAGTTTTVHIASSGAMTEHNYGSVVAVADSEGDGWLFGITGSESMIRFTESQPEKIPLALQLPLEIETVALSGEVIMAYGMDPSGSPATYSIDVSAEGSIDSGRGFLSMLYVATTSIVMGVMFWTAIKRMLRID